MLQEIIAQLQAQYPEGVPILQGLQPDEEQIVLQIYQMAGIQGVVQLLHRFIDSMGGPQGAMPQPQGNQGPPEAMPPGAEAPPNGPPIGAPMGTPVGPIGGMPPMGPMGGMPPMPQAGGPPQPNKPPMGPQQPVSPREALKQLESQGWDKWGAEEPPKYVLPDLPEESPYISKPPSYTRVMEDARTGRQVWQLRDNRILEDTKLYYLTNEGEEFGSTLANEYNQSVSHRRSQPAILIDRVTGLATAENDRTVLEVLPRAESDKHKKASQRYENWTRTSREMDEEAWYERSQFGDPQPPMPRKEAGLMALQGGMGWAWRVQTNNEEHPFKCEIVPWSELYPLGHATTRQFTVPLAQARGMYPEIDEYYKLAADDEDKGSRYYEAMDVRIISWSDAYGIWHGIAWEEAPSGGEVDKYSDTAAKWIKEPKRVNYGFCYYQYRIWGGTPSGALLNNRSQHKAYVGYGVLTMLRKTFRLLDLLISAIATGTLRLHNPATIQTHVPGTDLKKVEEVNLDPGARNFGFQGEDVKPLVFGVTGGTDGTTFLQSLVAELADATPTAPGGQASGLSHFQAAEQAGQLMVAPIIDALEKCYQDMNRQRGMLALRYGGKGGGKKLFEEYPFKGYRPGERGNYGALKVSELELSGVRTTVRYKRLDPVQEANLANMITGLVNAHLMSQETALSRLGIAEPEREMQRILQDSALMDKSVLKALVESAIMGGENQQLKEAWASVKMENMLAGSKGSEPAQAGTPSAPNAPGAPAAGMPGEFSNPMQMMQGA